MNKTKFRLPVATTGVLATLAFGSTALAQSSDAIIDKLVEKGILTTKEANELREEADKNFTTSYQVKSGMSDWVTSLRLNGDFRARFDGTQSDNAAYTDRNRFRYRLRFGFTAVMTDNLEVGLRLASGAIGANPISRNQTLEDNAALKAIGIDQAYARWSPINTPDWSGNLTVGKMANPFVFSDLVFDEDYTPEGAAVQLGYNLNDSHALKLNAGGFVLDEISTSGNDPYMVGAQLRFDSTWNKKLATSFGASGLAITGDDFLNNTGVPNVSRGNTRNAAGSPAFNFNPIIGDAAITYTLESFPWYTGPFPIRFAGDYIYNPAADDKNRGYTAGVTFGKSGKKKTWDVSYRYKKLEADAWYEEVVDSNSGAVYVAQPPNAAGATTPTYFAGTNLRGHIFKFTYSPYDSLTLAVTYYRIKLIDEPVPPLGVDSDSDTGRIQADVVLKF